MKTTRRSVILGSLAFGAAASVQPLAGCAGEQTQPKSGSLTQVTVLGAIHGRHRNSKRYSLEVLRGAIRKADPDIVLAEIPPDRLAAAKSSFDETGEVTEPRTKVFPELTDAVFPLSADMGFEIAACAGWTRAIADNRQAALRAIQNDPDRAGEWRAHQAARARYSREIAGRGDDPRFIHTPQYDALVKAAQAPYQSHFDADLGPGGWTQINAAHNALIASQLDQIAGKGMRALVIFGSWHKYMIERSVGLREDAQLGDPLTLFD